MNERAFVTLRRNKELYRYIEADAWRHFGKSEEDRNDAIALAWEAIWQQRAGQKLEDYKRFANNAIAALYSKILRRRKKEEGSFDQTGETPSSALAAIAKRAIDGDW